MNSIDAIRFRAAKLAERFSSVESRSRFARAFCGTAIASTWTAICSDKGCAWGIPAGACPDRKNLSAEASRLAGEIGQVLSQFPVEEAGYQAGCLYTALLPDPTRSALGAYYTPPALVQRLLDMATEAGFEWTEGRILDPACGGGAFLAPVALRLRRTLSGSASEILDVITTRLRGFELDPFAAWMSQVFLEIALLDLCVEAGKRLPNLVTIGDTLAMPIDSEKLFDLVIGNPPYRRITLDPEKREHYSRSLFGHANLYGLFTDAAIRWTRPGGLIAYVTPTSFLGGQYFKALRGLLAAEAPPRAVDFVTERQGVFEDVLQETMLAVYGRGGDVRPVRVHFIRPNGRNAPFAVHEVGTFPIPPNPEDPWLLPRDQDQAAIFGNLQVSTWRLADYGFGISTGQLVWNRHRSQLRNVALKDTLPLVWAESITTAGRFSFQAKRQNHAPYIHVNPGQKHLITSQPCVLVQRTTAKEQSRRLIAAVMPAVFLKKHGGAVVENHLNIIRPVNGRTEIPLRVLTTFLNSRTVDRIFRSISGSVAVSAYELNALPLPGPEAFRELENLIKQRAPASRIDAAIEEFYMTGGKQHAIAHCAVHDDHPRTPTAHFP